MIVILEKIEEELKKRASKYFGGEEPGAVLYSVLYSSSGKFCIKNFKRKNIQFLVKSFYQKKMERHLKKIFGHNWHANLHVFANICKLPVSNTFKDMHSKI